MGALPIRLDGARRILLIKPSALGDVVHTLPVVATLKKRYPGVALDWLIEEEAAPLVAGHPAIDAFVVSGRRRWLRWLRSPARCVHALREIRALVGDLRRRRYDASVDLQGLLKSAAYVVAAGAGLRIGLADGREGAPWVLTHRVPVPPPPVHAVERYLAAAAAMDAGDAVREFAIPIAPEDAATAQALLAGLRRPLVVLHPAARWATKLWETDRWRVVAAELGAAGAGVAVTGGVTDGPMASAICDGVDSARCLAGRLSLKELAAVLKSADLMVTVDSGPMHIAGALGTPVVALFGPTDPARTGPVGPAQVLRRSLPCSPCLSRRCRISETRRCMRDLDAAEVLEAARLMLGGARRTGSGG